MFGATKPDLPLMSTDGDGVMFKEDVQELVSRIVRCSPILREATVVPTRGASWSGWKTNISLKPLDVDAEIGSEEFEFFTKREVIMQKLTTAAIAKMEPLIFGGVDGGPGAADVAGMLVQAKDGKFTAADARFLLSLAGKSPHHALVFFASEQDAYDMLESRGVQHEWSARPQGMRDAGTIDAFYRGHRFIMCDTKGSVLLTDPKNICFVISRTIEYSDWKDIGANTFNAKAKFKVGVGLAMPEFAWALTDIGGA